MFRIALGLLLASRDASCFSVVGLTSRAALQNHVSSASTVLARMSSSSGDTEQQKETGRDDYDDWYEDFDPSLFGGEADSGVDVNYDMTPRGGGGGRGGGRGGGGRGRGGGGRYDNTQHDYSRDVVADNSNIDIDTVNSLISERLTARKTGRFEEADGIRDQLLKEHGVMIRDKERTWRSGCSESGSGQRWGGGGGRGGGRDGPRGGRRGGGRNTFGPKGHDYNPSMDAGPNQSNLPEEEIDRLLAERLQCKLNRNFSEADQIQEELFSAGVWVHDGRKEWRADGQGFGDFNNNSNGPRPGRERGSRNSERNRPYEESPESQETDETEAIQSLIDERMQAKLDRNYDVADSIREQLRFDYNVQVDDRLRQWSVGGEFREENRERGQPVGPYTMSRRSEVPEDPEEIQRLVDMRDEARKERDYSTADSVLEDLSNRNIEVDDRTREWSVAGSIPGAGTGGSVGGFIRRGGGSLSEEEEALIVELLKERNAYKRDKDYGKADRIRDRLTDEFSVRVDDKNKEWHVVTNEYAMSPGSAPLDEVTLKYVVEQVNNRAKAKLNRDYETADAIRDELMGDYLISIDDRIKEWTALQAAGSAMDEEVEEVEELVDDEVETDDFHEEEGEGEATDDMEAEENVETTGSAVSTDDLESLTVVELKDRLRDAGLPVSGKKAELVERLAGSNA